MLLSTPKEREEHMRKTALRITNEGVTRESLDRLISGHGVMRKGLRIAIIQGIYDNASITELSRRHHMSRQGIYLLVERVNEHGLHGLDEERRLGRKSRLNMELRKELNDVLMKPPYESGYTQSRWDGPLVSQYLKEHHGISLGHSQVNNWLHALGFTLQRGRQTFTKADPIEQENFIADVKKTS
jgi:transposase